jgi:excisionase family DNA binding protein
MKLLSTKEAAEKLNVSPMRVRQLIQEEKLKAKRIGRDYVIDERDLATVQTYGKAGRPKGKR